MMMNKKKPFSLHLDVDSFMPATAEDTRKRSARAWSGDMAVAAPASVTDAVVWPLRKS